MVYVIYRFFYVKHCRKHSNFPILSGVPQDWFNMFLLCAVNVHKKQIDYTFADDIVVLGPHTNSETTLTLPQAQHEKYNNGRNVEEVWYVK